MLTGPGFDLREATRTLRRDLRFHLPLVLLLAVPVAALVVAAAAVHALLLTQPPFPSPQDLVLVTNRFGHDGRQRIPASAPELLDYRERLPSLTGLSAVNSFSAALGGDGGRAEQLQVGVTSGEFFRTLGVGALHGRLYGAADDTPLDTRDSANSSVVVLGHDLWRRRYGSDPAVVGRLVRIGGTPMRIIGVLPAAFRLRLPPGGMTTALDAWTPLRIDYGNAPRDGRYLTLIGRLAPGRAPAQLAGEAQAASADLRSRFSAYERAGLAITVEPLHEASVAHLRPTILLLVAATCLVLLLSCVNAAGMLLARLVERGGELAVRVALGATARRLVGQLGTEVVLVVVLATGLGLAAGLGLLPALRATTSSPELPPLELPMSALLSLALPLALVLAGILALLGALPALRSTALTPQARGVAGLGRGRPRLRAALIAGEVALSMLLVAGAGLLLRSALALRSMPLGFEAARVMTFRVSLPFARYRGPAAWAERYEELTRELGELPGVEAVGVTDLLPASGNVATAPYAMIPAADMEWGATSAVYRTVSPGYFSALGMPLLAGRGFTAQDRPEAPPVVVVDEAFARAAWRGSAVGERLEVQVEDFSQGYRLARVRAEVIGVVPTVPHDRPDRSATGTIYLSMLQHPTWSAAVALRTPLPPETMLEPARRVLAALDPELPAYDARTLADIVRSTYALTDLALALLTAFAMLGLLVSAAGMFALAAYLVRATRREQAIRLACGATPAGLLRNYVRAGVRLALAGTVVGASLAPMVAGRLEGLLVGTEPLDPLTLAASGGLIVAVVGISTLAAAIGVLRTEPARLLRGG